MSTTVVRHCRAEAKEWKGVEPKSMPNFNRGIIVSGGHFQLPSDEVESENSSVLGASSIVEAGKSFCN